MDQRFKFDGDKADPRLLERDCVKALEAVSAALQYGKHKYTARSWKNVEPERYDAAARRHRIERDVSGDVLSRDAESNLPHIAHEITCLLFQLQMALDAKKSKWSRYTQYNDPRKV